MSRKRNNQLPQDETSKLRLPHREEGGLRSERGVATAAVQTRADGTIQFQLVPRPEGVKLAAAAEQWKNPPRGGQRQWRRRRGICVIVCACIRLR